MNDVAFHIRRVVDPCVNDDIWRCQLLAAHNLVFRYPGLRIQNGINRPGEFDAEPMLILGSTEFSRLTH